MKTYYISKKPPSSNTLFPTNWKTRRRYTSKDYAAWQELSMQEVLAQGKSGLSGDYCMEVYIPRKFRHHSADIVNLEKATTDLLVKAGLVPDDKHIVSYAIRYADCDRVQVNVFSAQNTLLSC